MCKSLSAQTDHDCCLNKLRNNTDEVKLNTKQWESLKMLQFCYKTESLAFSAKFWSQSVPLIQLRKQVPTLYVSGHKWRSYWEFKVSRPWLISAIVSP